MKAIADNLIIFVCFNLLMNYLHCHDEPIHIPGHIQSFGYLIGLNFRDKTVQFHSRNLPELLNLEENILGRPLHYYPDYFSPILDNPAFMSFGLKHEEGSRTFDRVVLNGTAYHLTLLRSGPYLMLELEAVLLENTLNPIYKGLAGFQNFADEDTLWQRLCTTVMNTIGYDHVMVYRFMEDHSGVVVAEDKLSHIPSYLDMHYPEADIPRQARALYLKNYRRIFSDVNAPAVELVSHSGEPVDLTYCSLRAMSPVHAIYLRNAGVVSSFSVSIIVDNQLWGLVTCHNSTQKHIDLNARIEAEICTMACANAYMSFRMKRSYELETTLNAQITEFKKNFLGRRNFTEGLFTHAETLRNAVGSDGFAAYMNGELKICGETPPAEIVREIVAWAQQNVDSGFFTSSFLLNHMPELAEYPQASGLAIEYLNESKTDILMWFQKEFVEPIIWHGKPEKEVGIVDYFGEEKLVYSPRTSFEMYYEERRGLSRHWSQDTRRNIQKLRDAVLEISYSLYMFQKKQNAELSALNEELDSYSYTISHDLATPLTVMKLNAQKLVNSAADVGAVSQRVSTIIGEIDKMSEMMNGVLQHSRAKHSEIKLQHVSTDKLIRKLTDDAKLTYNVPHCDIIIEDTPPVLAEKIFAGQVFQNVITNAVKYSSKSPQPIVAITGETTDDSVIYRITDNGIGIPEESRDDVFRIFQRVGNARGFAGSGVGMAIVKRIMDRLGGSVDFISNVNEGTTFILTFQKPTAVLITP